MKTLFLFPIILASCSLSQDDDRSSSLTPLPDETQIVVELESTEHSHDEFENLSRSIQDLRERIISLEKKPDVSIEYVGQEAEAIRDIMKNSYLLYPYVK